MSFVFVLNVWCALWKRVGDGPSTCDVRTRWRWRGFEYEFCIRTQRLVCSMEARRRRTVDVRRAVPSSARRVES